MANTVLQQTKHAVCVHKGENDEDMRSSNSLVSNDLDSIEGWWRRRDSNPRPVTGTRQALHA